MLSQLKNRMLSNEQLEEVLYNQLSDQNLRGKIGKELVSSLPKPEASAGKAVDSDTAEDSTSNEQNPEE